MKKIICILLLVMISICTGCSDNSVDIIESEPLYYSEDIRVVTKNLSTIEDLKGKVLAVQQSFDKEYSDYVIEELNKQGLELTEDNLYWFETYAEIKPLIDDESIDAWVVPGNREDTIHDYRSDYDPKEYNTLATFNKPYYEIKEEDTSKYVDYLYNKPFVVMLCGLDGYGDGSAYDWENSNNDVNHLMVVNPEKKHVLIVSFPRDSYIYNVANGYYDKLTHLCHDGPDNPGNSIGELLDVKVPYYCMTSFTWFVYGINAFGGLTLDVPMNVYLDMDSVRNTKNPQEIEKGKSHIFGESALAFARNRKYNNIVGGDAGRLRNQAYMINTLIDKIANHPYVLQMIGMDWLWDFLCANNFTTEEKETLMALAKTFEDGYTIDNYFVEGYDSIIDQIYFMELYDDCVEIAKGKVELVLNGKVDESNPYYEYIMEGYITKGAGTIDVGDYGYVGTEYDLRTVFGE